MASKLLAFVVVVVALLAGEYYSGALKSHMVPFAREWPHSSLISLVNYFGMKVMPQQVRVLEHVLAHAKKDSPEDVIAKVDEFCWQWPSMNVGDVKGVIADDALKAMGESPKVVMELGSYLGYSTVRFASVLQRTAPKAILYSVDPNPLGHVIKMGLLERAGLLGPQVRNEMDFSDAVIRRLAKEGLKIDYLFVDHIKELYKPDVELALDLGVLQPGSVVVADNVISPGAPEYRAWMLGNSRFETKVHRTLLEYTKTVPDEVLVSKLIK